MTLQNSYMMDNGMLMYSGYVMLYFFGQFNSFKVLWSGYAKQ